MRGLVAAATIMGCLKYGACFSGLDAQGQPVLQLRLKDEDLLEAPDDSAFLQSLRISSSRANNGQYSPLALVEAFTKATPYCGEPEKASEACDLGKQTAVQKNWWMTVLPNAGIHFPYLRAAICLWACNGWRWSAVLYFLAFYGRRIIPFCCLDAWKGDWVQLDKCGFIAPFEIEHIFDAFCIDPQRPWQTAASQALGIPTCHIAEDTHINQAEGSKFTLTPRRIADNPAEKSGEESGSGAESGWLGVSDNLGGLVGGGSH